MLETALIKVRNNLLAMLDGFSQVGSLEAGVDVLSFANQLVYHSDAARAITIILGLARAGSLKPERIEQSYRRITRL